MIDRHGRRPLYIVGSLGMTAVLALMVWICAFDRSIAGRTFHVETFPVFWPDLGPDVHSAFYGGQLEFAEVTFRGNGHRPGGAAAGAVRHG